MDVKYDAKDHDTEPSYQRTDNKPVGLSTWARSSAKHYKLFIVACLLSLAFRTLQTLTRAQSEHNDIKGSDTAASEPGWAPAAGWHDNVYPLRPFEPWDISTDFPHPRNLEYDVTEGTWLRLDVHPVTGDIIFDMAGDIYCLPADAYNESSRNTGNQAINIAHPVIRGVPHDSDPHFSPDGKSFVFRSDAESGIENIWATPWISCRDLSLERVSDLSLTEAVALKHDDNARLVQGMRESAAHKHRRLLREGRSQAQRVTNETFRWISDARFHPSGKSVIATKWFTGSRSLGAGEGWLYTIPESSATKVVAGDGTRVVGRTLPPGWSSDAYGEQQIGPEQFVWLGNDTLLFSKNVVEDGAFTYSKNVHNGIYGIYAYKISTKTTETVVSAHPGGANRPEVSRDGRSLAFVRRSRDKEVLIVKDLETGTLHRIWDGLSYDLSIISAPMGTYPSFSFTPSDDAIIIWARGQVYYVPLSLNSLGEKVKSDISPRPIPFVAHIEKSIAETRRTNAGVNILLQEMQDIERTYAFKELDIDETGKHALFQAANGVFIQEIGESVNVAQPLPVQHPEMTYYSPSFIPRFPDLAIVARWSNTHFTSFEIMNITSNVSYELVGLPIGRYRAAALCDCSGRNRTVAFVKTAGDVLTGDVVATSHPGLYLASLELPTASSDTQEIELHNWRHVPSDIASDDSSLSFHFVHKNTKLLVQEASKAYIIDLAGTANELGKYPTTTLATGRASSELKVSYSGGEIHSIGFVDYKQVYVAPADAIDQGSSLWSKPGNATKALARVSLDGGHNLVWTKDGKKLFWLLGPYLHYVEISHIHRCIPAIEKDPINFGIDCIQHVVKYQDIIVTHPTNIYRLKEDARHAHLSSTHSSTTLENSDVLVIANATILTMETGVLDQDMLTDAILVSKGGVISLIAGTLQENALAGAKIIDAGGGYVVPGFIDVHAHWSGGESNYPSTSWEHETFLSYGITTVHNPSMDDVQGFWERSRIESGRMIGPRSFQTGGVIYGADHPAFHQDIATMDEARSALIRLKAEGGPAAFSYKNYNLPSRASRQRLLLAAEELEMLCFPEGGMNWDWDLTYITDGMTTIEHALPIPVLYDDVLTLYALSGTGATPTHLVNYGGAWGEQIVWANFDVPNDEKLRTFTKHDILDRLAESTKRPISSWQYLNTSASVARMVDMGLLAHIGAHGEPPLGLNYHAEMYFTQQGGLSNYQVIQAATSSAAKTLGLWEAIGSITPGKLADFVIYPPGLDLLHVTFGPSTGGISYVVRGGRMWNASTMQEVWPIEGRKLDIPPINIA